MSVNGTYSFAYSGSLGVGVGVLSIQNSTLTGADLGGGRYHGVVIPDPESAGFRVVFDMLVPAGAFLVQNASPQAISHTRSGISVDFRPDFDNGEPIKIYVPPGDITLMVRRISDEYAWCASGVKVTITPA